MHKCKLTFKDKCCYSSAGIGDAIGYMFITTFIMFFLTTIAGIEPALAGTLTAIGTIWDAVVNPIIGYLSDHCRSKWGRRRPYMFCFCIPLFASMVLLYTAVDMSYTLRVIYYGLMLLAFWTSFTGFFVPFYALGAEYTQNYEERATLRSYASFFNMIGTLFSMAMPTMIVKLLVDSGITTQRAWQLTAIFLAIITVASILITVVASKDKDVCESVKTDETEEKAKFSIKTMLSEYIEVLKLGPMKYLLLTSLFYLIAYAMIMSDCVYLFTYNLGFDGNGVSLAMVVRSLIIIAFIPLINKLVKFSDKRKAQLIILALVMLGLLIVRFADINNMIVLAAFIFITAITTQTYWQIMPAIFYDVCEYDEYVTGNRREGAILSVQGLVEAVASGIGTQIVGLILQFSGFDGSAAEQSQTALGCIFDCTTWIPAIVLLFAGIALYKYPITKEKYNEIVRKLEDRKENR